MKYILFFHFIIFINTSLWTQDQNLFPEAFLGHWYGDLIVHNASGQTKYKMECIHAYTDSTGKYLWALKYEDGEKADYRPYHLIELDSTNGHYQIDEHNGILINSYLRGNRLISHFEVQGNQITSMYSIEGNELIFEIIFMDLNKEMKSGGTIFDGKTIPEVKSYAVPVYQKARLKRI